MIELNNICLFEFKDIRASDGTILIPEKALRDLDSQSLHGLPLMIQLGVIKAKIGEVHLARKGRDAMFGDIILKLDWVFEADIAKEEKKNLLGFMETIEKAIPRRIMFKITK